MKKEQLSVHGELIAYTPDKSFSSSGVIRITDRADIDNHDALGIPDPSTSVLQQLFANYAPTFEIDTVTNDDRIGMVKLDEAFTPYIDTSKPSLYQYVSYTRLAGQVLLQLNYVIWFPARTRTSALDLLGGHLDGITWRVTLLPDGNPLLFDSIHNCGCYHLLFPTQFTAIKTDRDGYEEPLLFAQQLEFPEQSKVHIRLSSGAHYIERVSFTASDVTKTVRYAIQDEDSLRSLLTPAGKRKSLYGPDGIIDSSARGERFLFWPMGVPSPGAMRQPGTHATAFVGRRHFDDAFLFQPYLDTRQLE